MTAEMRRWLLVVVLAVCILGLLVWARGQDHHRGEDIGARAELATGPGLDPGTRP